MIKKIVPQKNHIKAEHKKRHISEIQGTKSKTLYSHEPSAYSQRINYPKNVDVYLEDVKTEETFISQDQKLVETTNL